MPLDGRINIDVLFHDTDGTTSLKVVSLEDSTAYTTGKVAIVTGTAGTAAVTVASIGGALSYRDSTGLQAVFSSFERMAISSPTVIILGGNGQYEDVGLVSTGGRVSVCDSPPKDLIAPVSGSLTMRTNSGTASYTLVLYGT